MNLKNYKQSEIAPKSGGDKSAGISDSESVAENGQMKVKETAEGKRSQRCHNNDYSGQICGLQSRISQI